MVKALFDALGALPDAGRPAGARRQIRLAGAYTPRELARGRFPASFFKATVIVVDVHPHAQAVLDVCRVIRARRPAQAIAGLTCCIRTVCTDDLDALLESGVTSLLDWECEVTELVSQLRQLPDPEAGIALRARVAGAKAARIGGTKGSGRAGWAASGAEVEMLDETDRRIASLVAQGFSNRAIGRAVHLSYHAVDHRLDKLRHCARVTNRVELAAWAGANGIYPTPEVSPN